MKKETKENNKIIDAAVLIADKLDIDAFINNSDILVEMLGMNLEEYIIHMFKGLPVAREGFKRAIDRKIKKYREVKKLLLDIKD